MKIRRPKINAMKVGFVFVLCLLMTSFVAFSADKSKQKVQKEISPGLTNERVEKKQKKTHIQKWNCSEKQWEELDFAKKKEDSNLSGPDAYTKIRVWDRNESQWTELKN